MYQDEEWKTIKDYPNYMVSNYGRVKKKSYIHHHSDGRVFHNKERIKKQTASKGYLMVRLFRSDDLSHKGSLEKTHRLVAMAFIPNPENKPYIDHINTIRHDNRVENLRWCTSKENANNPLTLEKNRESSRRSYEDGSRALKVSLSKKKMFGDKDFMEKFKKKMNSNEVKEKMRRTSCCKRVKMTDKYGNVRYFFSAKEAHRQTGRAVVKFCLSGIVNSFGEKWEYCND